MKKSIVSNYDLPEIVKLHKPKNEKGEIIVLENLHESLSLFRRAYFLKSDAKPQSHGQHGHKALKQFFVCLTGSASVYVTNKHFNKTYELSDCAYGLFLPSGFWREITLKPNTILAVIASELYDPEDYVFDKGEYIRC
ncbi:WxcM-like protein [Rhodobacteraceae bacterium HIMB11]|nr:WxcM-like protein [Rhodobacteraceae bacterium HIMB11]